MVAQQKHAIETHWPAAAMVPDADGRHTMWANTELCNAKGFLFGGWTLGAVAAVGQQVTGLRLRDLSASYAAAIREGSRVDITTHVLTSGRTLSQLRLEAWVGPLLALSATGVFGPDAEAGRSATTMPDVPPPAECPHREYSSKDGSGSSRLIETRVVSQTRRGDAQPRTLLWVAIDVDLDADVRVAVVSDHVPTLVRRATDYPFVPTVSGTLRLHGRATSRYLLLDVRMSAWDGMLASGDVDVWNEDGSLVASAGQTSRLFSAS